MSPLKVAPDALAARQPPTPGTSTYETTLRDEAIARAIASGFDRDKLMAYYELTPAGLRAVMARIEPLVARYRERFQTASQMKQVFLEQLAPKGLENVEAILNDPTHKEHAYTSRWVVEQASEAKLNLNGGFSLEVSPQALDTIKCALETLAAAKSTLAATRVPLEQDPHLISGPK